RLAGASFGPALSARVGTPTPPFSRSRQRRELDLVARHHVEAAPLPVLLGFLDLLLRRGDEVPPDVARAVHRLAAEQQEAGIRAGGDRYRVARLEHQQLTRAEAVAGDLD